MSVSVMVLVPLPPCVTLTLLGEADNEKSGCGAALTVRLTVVVCVSVPLVPVIVTVAVPVGAAGGAAERIGRADRPARVRPGRSIGRKLQLQVGGQEAVAAGRNGSVDEGGGRDGNGAGPDDAAGFPGADRVARCVEVDVGGQV